MGKRMIGATLAAVLLVALVAGSAWAQETQTLELTPSRDSGVSGTANLTETDAGLEVQFEVQGLTSADGTEHIAHIHEGATCADDRADQGAPVEFPLQAVVNQGGAGSSTSTIEDSLDELSDDVPHYIAVHDEVSGEGTPPVISCADITDTSVVPSTGGPISPLDALLIGGAVLATLGIAAVSLLAWRRA